MLGYNPWVVVGIITVVSCAVVVVYSADPEPGPLPLIICFRGVLVRAPPDMRGQVYFVFIEAFSLRDEGD
jgi:hypothetical protein